MNEKTVYIDPSGNVILESKYEVGQRFTEGLAAVRVGGLDGQWGYMNRFGKLVIEAQYESALPFSGNVAAVQQEDKWGLIDKSGQWIAEPEFDRIYLR